MESKIDKVGYQPSSLDLASATSSEPPVRPHCCPQDLNEWTARLKHEPYDPRHWLERGRILMDLGYPELALGDSWKAECCCRVLLLRGMRCSERSRSRFIDEHASMTSWQYVASIAKVDEAIPCGLRAAAASVAIPPVVLEELQRAVSDLQNRIISASDDGDQICRFVPRPYPWLKAEHDERDQDVLDRINFDLARSQSESVPPASACLDTNTARACPSICVARVSDGVDGGIEQLGVFAQRDIAVGESLLADRTDLAGHDITTATGCLTIGLHDMSWLYDIRLPAVSRTMLMIRCLAEALREDGDLRRHPLDHHLFARLRPTYHHDQGDRQLQEKEVATTTINEIAAVNLALLQLGVDVFANLDFDSWVLYTIEARLANNIWTEPDASYLSPVFAMMNHSCDPNVHRWHERQRKTMTLTAARHIEAGEQLFVSYHAYIDHLGVAERRSALRQWIDGNCQCKRCESEACISLVPQTQRNSSELLAMNDVIW